MEAIVWLAILIILLIVEIATLGLSTVWFAGGALVACLAALCGAGIVLQIILFFVVSIVLVLFTRPIAVRYMNRNRTKTNAESLIGESAVVIAEINNLRSEGQVQVKGLEWTARSLNENEVIEKDTIVEIMKIEGVKLIVKRKEGNE